MEANEEVNECAEESTLNIAVNIDEETLLHIVAMVSEYEHYFPLRKEMEMNLFFLDTCAGVSCFNRLRLNDIIDWSKTGNLNIGIRGQSLRVQGVGSS